MTPAFESFQVGKSILEVIKAAWPPSPHFYVYNLYIQLYNYIYNLYSTSMSRTSSSKEGWKSQLYKTDLSTWWARSYSSYNPATEAGVELERKKTAVVIPKLLIKRDTNVTKGRRISKLDLEKIIQEGADLMLMKDRQDLSMSSCNILGGNYFHFSRQS